MITRYEKTINETLDDPEKKSRVDRIIPLLHGKWELQIMLEICRFDMLRFGEIKKRFPHITNTVLTGGIAQFGKLGTSLQNTIQ